MKKAVSLILILVLCTSLLASCGNASTTAGTTAAGTDAATDNSTEAPSEGEASTAADGTEAPSGERTLIRFTMEDGSTFTLEMYPEYAPKTVENFVSLVKSGFYDGLTFHRVIDDFMAQGGDPEGTGRGGSENKIPGEFSSAGWTANTLKHTRGVISMARSTDVNSASSQFFICYGDCPSLDGKYAAFGKVTEGMETVDAFLEVKRTEGSDGNKSKPVTPIVIKTAEVIASAESTVPA